MSDAELDVLKYDDIDADVMRALLMYIYGDSLPLDYVEDCSVDLLVVADRFGIDRLSKLLQTLIVNNMSPDVAAGKKKEKI